MNSLERMVLMGTQGTTGIDTTLIIAVLGLLTSLATLFVSYLSPGKVKCSFGPTITLFYKMKEPLIEIAEGSPRKKTSRKQGHPLYIYVPTTFINSGSKADSIFRIALAIHKKENPNQTYYMDWRAFCSYHRETGMWGEDELAHQVSIKGNSTESKWISFYWGLNPGVEFSEGSYIVDIYYWNRVNSLPKEERHELHIGKVNIFDIKNNLKTTNRDMVELSLDDKNRPNALTTQREVGGLINEKSKGFILTTNRVALASILLGAISYVAIYFVENSVVQPYHSLWWLNPRIISVLVISLPIIFGCIFTSVSSLFRLWDSRKIIDRVKNGRLTLVFQIAAPFIGTLLGIASIFYIISLF